MREGSFQSRAWLWIVLLATCVLIYWLATKPVAIEDEGAEYARIAENLVKGIGYVGMMGGPQLFFPPLYPILIAALHFLVGDFELAGRLVSLIFGTCLVIPVYAIANLLYGRRVALISAFLVACHPILVGLSVAVYSECPYATLLLTGVYWSLRALKLQSHKHTVAAGIFLGLAYLARPEAAVVPVLCAFSLFAVALLNGKEIRKAIYGSALLATVFAAVIAPYVVFLTLRTGTLMTDGKHNINAMMRSRVNTGMSYRQAAYGVNRESIVEGPLLEPNAFVTKSPFKNGLADVIPYVLTSAKGNVRSVFRSIFALHFGYPVLFLLIVIGLFRSPWNLQRTVDEGFLLLLFAALALVILAGAPAVWDRIAFPVLPLLLLWVAKGADELSDWAEKSVSSMGHDLGRLATRIGLAVRLISPVVLLLVAALGFRFVGDLQDSYGPNVSSKRAGLWLGEYMPGSDKRIMDTGIIVAYYSGGLWMGLPYADSDVALAYIRKKQPEFIVLQGRARGARPYLDAWLKWGIPDESAQLIYRTGTRPDNQVRIYRWVGRGLGPDPISQPNNTAAPPGASPASPLKPNPR